MSRSIQSLPNNSGTTSIAEVYTSTGFSAGDPVFFQNGDYKSPANLPVPFSVSANFTPSTAINSNGTGGIINPAFSYAQLQTGLGGGSSRKFAAVLTNGNIVQVFINRTGSPVNQDSPYFRITNASNTVVVAPTVITTVFTQDSFSSVGVAALTGGGFVVVWVNTAGGTTQRINYAIYSNTGSLVTSPTQDTSISVDNGGNGFNVVGLANGGFAIAAKNDAANVRLRAYNATGVATYAAITVMTAISGPNIPALTARSDSSVFVCDILSANQYGFALYNSSGGTIVSLSTFNLANSLTNTVSANASAATLSDGTTIVIGFSSINTAGNALPAFRFFPASNVLGAAVFAVPLTNAFYTIGTQSNSGTSVLGLSAGGFLMVFSDAYGNMLYSFYSSAGVPLSGSNLNGAIPLLVTGGFSRAATDVTLIELSGSVNAYWSTAQYTQKSTQQVYCRFSKTTYKTLEFASATTAPVVVSGITPGAVAPPATTPVGVSYYAAASSTRVVTNTPSIVTPVTIIAPIACDSLSSDTLPNGNFVVTYRGTNFAVFAAIYSPSGSLINTVSVGAGYALSSPGAAKIAALSSGRFVVAYPSAETIISLAVYSGSGDLLSIGSITCSSWTTGLNHDVSGLQDDRFVLACFTGAGSLSVVYNASCVQIASYTNTQIGSGVTVCGNPWGGFAVSGFFVSNSRFQSYYPIGTNDWHTNGAIAVGGDRFVNTSQMTVNQSGNYVLPANGSDRTSWIMVSEGGVNAVNGTASSTGWAPGGNRNPNADPFMGVGLTGNGNLVFATGWALVETDFSILAVPAQVTLGGGAQVPFNVAGGSNVTMSSRNGFVYSGVTRGSSSMHVASNVGNNCVVTFMNAVGNPCFAIINATNDSTIYSVTAGVTASAVVPVAPTTSSSTINGILAGVAVTSATAGSTGQLAVGGQVLLGSSYTSTATGSFDSTGQAVSGVRGTFNGRSVNIQGNT